MFFSFFLEDFMLFVIYERCLFIVTSFLIASVSAACFLQGSHLRECKFFLIKLFIGKFPLLSCKHKVLWIYCFFFLFLAQMSICGLVKVGLFIEPMHFWQTFDGNIFPSIFGQFFTRPKQIQKVSIKIEQNPGLYFL